MTTHTEDQGAGAGEVAADTTRRGVSRRTALKAAVATGAAIYAIPAIDTLTAHAAGVSTFKNNNVFIRTCGGSATFKSPYGNALATVTIAPTAGCGGNNVTINDPNTPLSPGSGVASSSIEVGTTNDQIDVTMNNQSFFISITNVVDSCQSASSGQQAIAITASPPSSGTGASNYSVPQTNLLTGKVALTLCP